MNRLSKLSLCVLGIAPLLQGCPSQNPHSNAQPQVHQTSAPTTPPTATSIPATPTTQASGTPQPSPTGTTPSGRLLFQSNKTPAQLTHDKNQFLDTVNAVDQNGFYSINNRAVAYRHQPYTPAIFGYVTDTDQVALSVKFSEDFRNNLPQPIIHELSQHHLDQLDIFFTPQAYDGKGFKAHAWAADPPAIPFVGTVYNERLPMGIYESDHVIDQNLRSGVLTPWDVHVHHDTLSPRAPELNINPGTMLPLSFWSLVIDNNHRRAAATLHWILGRQQTNEIRQALQADFPNGSLRELMQRMRNSHTFQNTPLLRKLEELTH